MCLKVRVIRDNSELRVLEIYQIRMRGTRSRTLQAHASSRCSARYPSHLNQLYSPRSRPQSSRNLTQPSLETNRWNSLRPPSRSCRARCRQSRSASGPRGGNTTAASRPPSTHTASRFPSPTPRSTSARTSRAAHPQAEWSSRMQGGAQTPPPRRTPPPATRRSGRKRGSAHARRESGPEDAGSGSGDDAPG